VGSNQWAGDDELVVEEGEGFPFRVGTLLGLGE
jgi:hypothetical protein